MISKIIYKGELRTEAIHIESGNVIITDAPKDNQGRGGAFSPTDLVATALGSCMLTIMGIVAKRKSIDIDGSKAEIEKKMSKDPRRISEICIKIYFVKPIDKTNRELLERAAHTCPVSKSLNDELNEIVQFIYPQ